MSEKAVITPRHVARLVEFAEAARLQEVVWQRGEQKIFFHRRTAAEKPDGSLSPPEGTTAAPESVPPVPSVRYVRSPMVGTFWLAVSKDRPPLVVEQDEITVGERIAVVEAMKVPKDVISDVSGRITKILVENGKPVEYGQKLFRMQKP